MDPASPSPADWQAFAGVAGVVALLGGLVAALRSFGVLRARPEHTDLNLQRIQQRSDLDTLRAALERHEQTAAGATAEIGRQIDSMRAATGRIHARIDAVAGDLKRVEGELGEVRRTARLILERMLQGETK